MRDPNLEIFLAKSCKSSIAHACVAFIRRQFCGMKSQVAWVYECRASCPRSSPAPPWRTLSTSVFLRSLTYQSSPDAR